MTEPTSAHVGQAGGQMGPLPRSPLPPIERLRAFHIGGYWRGPNDVVRQMMLGLRSAGAEVFEYNTDEHPEALDCEGRPYDRGTYGPVWLREEHLLEPIQQFRPHVVICNAGGLSFRPLTAQALRQQTALLGIALSDPDVFKVATSRIARNFDLFLTNSPECLPGYRAMGASAESLPFATNSETFHPLPPKEEYQADVLILGRAHADRVEPVRAICERFQTHVYGEDWDAFGIPSRGFLYDEEVLLALSSARMTVVFGRTHAGHLVLKPQILDFAAAGALVVTEEWDGLREYFEVGKEIVGFGSSEDLNPTIAHLLSHPQEADLIRSAGRGRVLREHTWPKVWPGIARKVSEAVSPGWADAS